MVTQKPSALFIYSLKTNINTTAVFKLMLHQLQSSGMESPLVKPKTGKAEEGGERRGRSRVPIRSLNKYTQRCYASFIPFLNILSLNLETPVTIRLRKVSANLEIPIVYNRHIRSFLLKATNTIRLVEITMNKALKLDAYYLQEWL